MSIHILHANPMVAPRHLCDWDLPRAVEIAARILSTVSASIRRPWLAELADTALTQPLSHAEQGRLKQLRTFREHLPPLREDSPLVVWAGESWYNWLWVHHYGRTAAIEYLVRFGEDPEGFAELHQIGEMGLSPEVKGQAKFAHWYRDARLGQEWLPQRFRLLPANAAQAVQAHREYYYCSRRRRARWAGAVPDWWQRRATAP